MQPYMNPNYFNQYQQPSFQPGYQQQMPQMNVGTRYCKDFNEIQVNEIPMDGKYVLFAKPYKTI